MIRNFEVIGEASRNIGRCYPAFAEAHPEVPLAFAYEMRNALAHGYFKVDFEIVWKTIERNLSGFAVQIRGLAAQIEAQGDGRLSEDGYDGSSSCK